MALLTKSGMHSDELPIPYSTRPPPLLKTSLDSNLVNLMQIVSFLSALFFIFISSQLLCVKFAGPLDAATFSVD